MSRCYVEWKKRSLFISGKNIVKQKLAYAGHVLRGSSGLNALLVLEGKFDEKKSKRRTWIDDAIQWMQKKKYDEVKRLARDPRNNRLDFDGDLDYDSADPRFLDPRFLTLYRMVMPIGTPFLKEKN